mmetsp:Transcript_68421/g.135559  ORF Transcript_68421/g.135559 Transcript_68421/m.135559 type:complete len:103 (-) Transcript_68421:341-649(-)
MPTLSRLPILGQIQHRSNELGEGSIAKRWGANSSRFASGMRSARFSKRCQSSEQGQRCTTEGRASADGVRTDAATRRNVLESAGLCSKAPSNVTTCTQLASV